MNNLQQSILSQKKMNLTEQLIFDVFKQVITQHENKNKECHALSSYLINNFDVLSQVSPTQLLHGYTLLSDKAFLDKQLSFHNKLQEAFGLENGNRFFYGLKTKNMLPDEQN